MNICTRDFLVGCDWERRSVSLGGVDVATSTPHVPDMLMRGLGGDGEQDVKPMVEVMPFDKINEAMDKVRKPRFSANSCALTPVRKVYIDACLGTCVHALHLACIPVISEDDTERRRILTNRI